MQPKKTSPSKLKDLAMLPEKSANAGLRRTLCHECERHAKCDNPFLFEDDSRWSRQLLILVGEPLNEDALHLLAHVTKELGIEQRTYTVRSALGCHTSKKPSMFNIRACRPFLVDYVKRTKPHVILALGDVALRAATNDGKLKTITPLRGIRYAFAGLEEQDTHVYGTYGLNEVTNGGWSNLTRIKEDLLRAVGKLPVLHGPSSGVNGSAALALDTEYMSDGRVVTISTADCVSADCADVTERAEVDRIYAKLFGASLLQGHSISNDLDALVRRAATTRVSSAVQAKLNRWIQGYDVEDSLIMARMHDETRVKGGYKLETLLRSSFEAPEWKEDDEVEDLSNPLSWPTDYRIERCAYDAWASAVLCDHYRAKAPGPVLLTTRIAQVIRRIYHAGAYIDEKYFSRLTDQFERDAQRAKRPLVAEASRLGMTEFSPTNDNDLRELLFKRMKLKVGERTKKGNLPSVGKLLLKQNETNPTIKLLMEFNKYDKRHSTYGVGLAKKFLKSGRHGFRLLRFRINPLGAKTGRRASDKPNAQNWPKDVRQIIVSRFAGGAIVDNDYSKLEVILFAWTAKEYKLLEFFLKGNGYIAVGKELFGKEVKEDTDDYRTVKSIVLGIQYGMGAFKLALQLWNQVGVKLSADWEEHVECAARLREKYLQKFPKIKEYMWNQKQYLLKYGYVKSLTGRIRHLPCPWGEDTVGFGRLLNQAINFPIQSLASDVTGSAMLDVETALLSKYGMSHVTFHSLLLAGKYPSQPLLINEVHDDLVYDMPPKGLKDNLVLIKETMAAVPTLRKLVPSFDCPLNTGQKVGSRWGLDDKNPFKKAA